MEEGVLEVVDLCAELCNDDLLVGVSDLELGNVLFLPDPGPLCSQSVLDESSFVAEFRGQSPALGLGLDGPELFHGTLDRLALARRLGSSNGGVGGRRNGREG